MYLFFLLQIWEGRNFLYQARNVWQFNIIALEISVQVLILQNKTCLEIVLEKKKIHFSTQTANKLFTGFFPECSVIQFSSKRWYIPETLETFLLSIVCQSISSCEIWRFSTLAQASYLETYEHFFGCLENAT